MENMPPANTCSAALQEFRPKWTLEIIHQAFNGCRQFEEFQRSLGVARNLLSSRLQYLQHQGILKKIPVKKNGRRKEYQLTNKGIELLPLMVALHQWGEKWHSDSSAGVEIVDIKTLSKLAPMVPLNQDGEEVSFQQIRIIQHANEHYS